MWNIKNTLITILAGATIVTGGTVLALEQGDTNQVSRENPVIEDINSSFVPSPEFNLPFEITEDYFIYIVKEGDTLESITEMFGISVEELIEIIGTEELFIGQEIKIPRG